MNRYGSKRAVIIGGTSGIGLATAKMLLDGGARVLLTGRSQAGLESAQKPTMLQRLKSWIEWFAKLEERFVGDPHEPIKRLSELELEIRALKGGTTELHSKERMPTI